MTERDLKHIQNMLEAAHAALVFSDKRTQEQLFGDTRLVFALVKALDLLGDAASRVSPDGREAAAQINWDEISTLPQRIYHDNDDINLSVVWDAVTNEIPQLSAQLQHLKFMHSS